MQLGDESSEGVPSNSRTPFGVSEKVDWWGRHEKWHDLYKCMPVRMSSVEGIALEQRQPLEFDETIQVVSGWHHMTSYGILPRVILSALQQCSHLQLQLFYFLLQSAHENRTFAGVSPNTQPNHFFYSEGARDFSRQFTKMTEVYSHCFVAVSALECIWGIDHEGVQIARNWVSVCSSFWVDLSNPRGSPTREVWNVQVGNLLEQSLFRAGGHCSL